jgi:hypothetical protein
VPQIHLTGPGESLGRARDHRARRLGLHGCWSNPIGIGRAERKNGRQHGAEIKLARTGKRSGLRLDRQRPVRTEAQRPGDRLRDPDLHRRGILRSDPDDRLSSQLDPSEYAHPGGEIRPRQREATAPHHGADQPIDVDEERVRDQVDWLRRPDPG